MTKLLAYQIALMISLAVNVVLGAGIALYIHFAGLLDIIDTAVGIFG